MTKKTTLPPLPDPTGPDAWMTVEEVTGLLSVARSTLDKWRRRPELAFPAPKRMPNGAVRYFRPAIATWLENLPEAA